MRTIELRKIISQKSHNACRGCEICDGRGCNGEIPGMGGKGTGTTFINNYLSWENILVKTTNQLPKIGVAPMTGVEENMGYPCSEQDFHQLLVAGAKVANISVCIGDGSPLYKLESGRNALIANEIEGTAFVKPYADNQEILKRYKLVEDFISEFGIDIDAVSLKNMQGKANLEIKGIHSLQQIQKAIKKPFIIKGIHKLEQIELIKELKPFAVVISNHGGRVFDNGEGIAFILQKLAPLIKNYTQEIWVDGGLRNHSHLLKAKALEADKVLVGRPFIQAIIAQGSNGIKTTLKDDFQVEL